MKITNTIIALCIILNANAQKKDVLKTYWVNVQGNFIYGTENTAGFSVNAGKNIHKRIGIGLGYSNNEYNSSARVNSVELVGEYFITEKSRQLFIQVKPGINFLQNAKKFTEENTTFEYSKNPIGFNVYAGAGIRFMVKRHAFTLGIGMQNTNYSVTALEYPVPVNPYNPFVEDALKHTYKYNHQKLVFSVGVHL